MPAVSKSERMKTVKISVRYFWTENSSEPCTVTFSYCSDRNIFWSSYSSVHGYGATWEEATKNATEKFQRRMSLPMNKTIKIEVPYAGGEQITT